MPCWERREITVQLDAADPALLRAGLRAAGFELEERGDTLYVRRAGRISIGAAARITGGQVIVDEADREIVNEITRAYSAEVVRATARRFGWTAQETGPNRLKLGRRF
jgi:hypothetical protein